MSKPYHIHDVLDMIRTSDTPFTESSLLDCVDKTFGQSACFTSCSDQVFGKEGIIPFLHSRGKIREEDGIIHLMGSTCNH